jgi:hypothetical protein
LLDAIGRSVQFGRDCCRPDCAADPAHRFADGTEEGPTGVLHQMATICDLYRMWRAFAAASPYRLRCPYIGNQLECGLLEKGKVSWLSLCKDAGDPPAARRQASESSIEQASSPPAIGDSR